MTLATADMRRWAALGAEQRLRQLAEETALIYRTFPELRRRGTQTATAADTATEPEAKAPRRRRRLSAAARKRISDAQKARWAKRRAAAK